MREVDSSSRICRSDRCELDGLHLQHQLTPFHIACTVCSRKAGQLCDIVRFGGESLLPATKRKRAGLRTALFRVKGHYIHLDAIKVCGIFHHERILSLRSIDNRPVRSKRDVWELPSPLALDEAILRSVSTHVPRLLVEIQPLVENDYGSLGRNVDSGMRRLQRRILQLCETGAIMRVELGKRLFAYLSPKSRLSLEEIRDQVMDNLPGWNTSYA